MKTQINVEEYARSVFLSHKRNFFQKKQDWLELYDRYENKLREGSITEDTESKITLGGAFSLVENALPRILARQPKYKYLAREGSDSDGAEHYEEFSEYQWEEADAQRTIGEIAKWGLITGLAGWKIGWKIENIIKKEKRKEILGVEVVNPMMERFATLKERVTEETTHNYTLQCIRPFDLIWDEAAFDARSAKVLGHAQSMTYNQAKAMGLDVKRMQASIKDSEYWKTRMDQHDKVTSDYKRSTMENATIRVAELYVKVLDETGKYLSYVVFIGDVDEDNSNPVVLKTEANQFYRQFCPIGLFRPINRPGRMYGFGLIEPVIGILEAEEDTLNMVVEAFWTDTSRPMEYNPNNLLDVDALEYRPRTLVPVRNLGQSVRVMETPTPSMSGFSFVSGYLKQAKQNASGITDFQTGAGEIKGDKTLGEVQIKTQESNARIAMILQSFEKEVLEPIGKYALYLNQQYLPDKYVYRILNRKGEPQSRKIKFKDIQAIKDIVIVSGSTALTSQSEELQKYSLLLNQIYLEEKSPKPVVINKEPIWEDLFEKGLLIKDVERYIPSLKELEQTEVGNDNAQIDDAKSENQNPLTARVLPDDNPEIHIPLHKAEIEARQNELQGMEAQGVDVPPQFTEELQMLIQHLNDHVAAAGGPVPQHSAEMQVGQGIQYPEQNAPQGPPQAQ